MNSEELNKLFDEAFENAKLIPQSSVPIDLQLILYGLYKQATSNDSDRFFFRQESQNIRSAFKLNAWMQVNNLSAEEAKTQYIEIINKLMKERNL
ncbi:acyl-CoA-binding protein [Flavobacterium sp. SM15]|uniref:acyl-CoA-binding protein n=1 Tax=Flavobacterium sp. SM15 TaxID=2908005 RepID=UPI001EDB0A89|nr:acyl-CoA-binding protein [Flavobacterium sp. SM15]MCG2612412.1 acyl-CoA-binding protein [Flavobacterium sp. SM15]